jgi:indolepyruvate ferredoxin oxidoreductase alpha subunit
MAHGLEKAGEPMKVVGIVGDSTFFHSGVTGLLDIAYNKGTSTIIVVDNRTTAMTGHQDHPGTGRTLMGEVTGEVSIEAIGRACGIRRVRTVDPYDIDATVKALREELAAEEPSLIVSKAACPLNTRERVGEPKCVDEEKCKNCHACLKLGCPALECAGEGAPEVNPLLCNGCGLCMQVCKPGAIATAK